MCDDIVIAQHHDARLPLLRERLLNKGVTHNGQTISDLSEVCRGSVQNDCSRPGLPGNDVGFETLSVGEVAAQNPFVRKQPNLVHQIRGDGQTAFVVKTRSGDLSPMNFRFQQMNLHESNLER